MVTSPNVSLAISIDEPALISKSWPPVPSVVARGICCPTFTSISVRPV